MAKRRAKKSSKTTARGGAHGGSDAHPKLPPSMTIGGGDITIVSDPSTGTFTLTISSKTGGDVMVIEGGGGVGGNGGGDK